MALEDIGQLVIEKRMSTRARLIKNTFTELSFIHLMKNERKMSTTVPEKGEKAYNKIEIKLNHHYRVI